MMSVTHAAISAAGVSLALGSAHPTVLAIAILGSQLPDLDSSQSFVGRLFLPISRWIEDRYPHRTITHSLLATAAIALLCFPLIKWQGLAVGLALPLGHLFACFADTCTKEGVGLFYPSTVRAIYGSNPKMRLATGSKVEFFVLGFFILLAVLSVNLQSAGGLMSEFNRVLGFQAGVVQLYNRNGGTHHVWANIKGVRQSDRSRVDGRFLVVGSVGGSLVYADGTGLYRAEKELLIERARGEVGASAQISEEGVTFDDDDAVEILSRLTQSREKSLIYLSGSLEIDEPDRILQTADYGQFESVKLERNRLTFELAPIEKAIALLENQYGMGSLTAKIISPRPEGF